MSVEIRENEIEIQRVVSFTLSNNKTFVEVKEGCDYVFSEDLNKPELAQLIAALQAMHDKMIDNNEGE